MKQDGMSRRDAIKSATAVAIGAAAGGPAALAAGAGAAGAGGGGAGGGGGGLAERARAFLADYNARYQLLYYAASQAQWAASTDVSDANTRASIAAAGALNEFVGEKSRLEVIQELRGGAWRLDPLTNRQVGSAFFKAAQYPGTLPELVRARTEAEAQQSAAQDGYRFSLTRPGSSAEPITANGLDDILTSSRDVEERRAAWEASKEIGGALKPGLVTLRDLRNRCARELGFSSYFGLMVGEYGMTPAEMLSLAKTAMEQTRPLFEQIHCFTKHALAERYGQAAPRRIPAHWVPNRWGQQWGGLIEAANLDPLFTSREARWMVEQAERFYVSMGFPALPASFWEKSDLWDLPADSPRKKNTHASAWHLDLDHDVRSLMSVKANYDWFTTTHHELGHIYYYLAYTDAGAPLLLREGANRAFHEAVGELIALACSQRPYLAEIGVLDAAGAAAAERNAPQWLLAQAMEGSNIVFQPWSWGVMTGWEHDFYEKDLPADRMNARWWELVAQTQGIDPPTPRGEEHCDPATKTHINDDPAGYYDYAVCSLMVYQLHGYIAKNILKQDPHNCNYYGRKDVGEYLLALLSLGATRDWREVLRDFTGEDLSARAMLEYYEPLMPMLKEINKGRDVAFG
ncbi:MAG: M2 family metallopeptidase [Planctomycetota bacterium]|nr:M2 family metallopeptidase [Planctomycetota bacterium]